MTPSIDCSWLHAHLRFSTYFYIVIIAYLSLMICTLRVTLIFICDIISNGNAPLIDFNNSMPTHNRRIRQDHGNRRFSLKFADLTQKEGHGEKGQGTISKNQTKRMRLHTDLDQIPILCRFRSKALHIQFQINNFILVLGSFLQMSSN